jgi:hypothetical protein
MKVMLPPVLIAGIVLMMMVSCSKTGSKPPAAPPSDTTGTGTPGGGTTPKTTDVYVCGSDNGKPCYWKNGTEVIFRGDSGAALSIVVNDTDVYVCGYVNYGPIYWKNGVSVSLQQRNSGGAPTPGYWFATGIAFADSNIYVAVDQRVESPTDVKFDYYAVVNPSGASTEIGATDGLNGATINSIFVSGTDIYSAGSGLQRTGTQNGAALVGVFASYYLNGNEHFLSATPNLSPVEDYVAGAAAGIAVSGSDVYVVGAQAPGLYNTEGNANYPYPIYWKNNVGQALPGPNGGVSGAASSIVLSGSDVYISGSADMNDAFDEAVYWKNGVMTICGSGASLGQSIGVSPSGDVYVAGYQYETGSNNTSAVVWKNGGATMLGTANASMANGVFVYTH